MEKTFKHIALAFSFILLSATVFAQADRTLELCDNHIVPPFVSDGQEYRALLKGDELAEFNVTFYGGSTYRIVACSGNSEGNLIFSLYDREKNLLFTNRDYQNTPYWDFEIKNTVNIVIEAELKDKENSSGFAFLQIGFKQ
jgi:hypothetical protein